MVIRIAPKSLGFFVLSAFVLAAAPAHAATFTVNVLTDAADANAGNGQCETATATQCTLRAAIQEANALAGDDVIEFSVTGTITATSALPAITQPLFIDGPLPIDSVIVDGATFGLFSFTGTGTGDYSISNLTIRNGRATNGGGINFAPTAFSTLQLTDVTLSTNQALGGAGGGVAIAGAANNELTIVRGSITGNTATGNGGGVSAAVGTFVNLTDVTVSGNSAANGGGIGLSGATLDLATSTLSGNTATADGGGLFLGVAVGVPTSTSSSAKLNLCTIAGNTATNGGGIGATSTNNSPSSMVHCTVAGNTATAANGGGGIGVQGFAANANTFFPGDSSNPFTNNIIADNNAGNPAQRSDCRQSFAHTDPDDSDYNVTSTPGGTNTACGFTQTNSTANAAGCTGSLANRLGLTQTRNLSAGCAGAVDKANTKWDSTTDQRGAPVANGNKLGGSERDIGAYEFAAYGAVEFGINGITVREDAGTVQAQVSRYGNLPAGSANFGTALCPSSNCTPAEAGDFTATNGTKSWASNESQAQNIDVPIVDDTEVNELSEQFDIVLSNLTQGSDVGLNGSARITITDIENGALQFVNDAATACEDDTDTLTCPPDNPLDPSDTPMVVSFDVERAGVNTTSPTNLQDVTVTLAYSGVASAGDADNSCEAGEDFRVSVSGTVSTSTLLKWVADDVDPITITLTACDDTEFEPDEAAILTLTTPTTNGARVGTPAQATATFVDNDTEVPGVFNIDDDPEYIVAENVSGGLVTITVTRTGGNDQAVSVDYRTSAGTASAGSDYSSRSGTLNWAAEDSADKTFTVPIVNDGLREVQEQFTVILSNPNNTDGGTDPTLGTTTTAPVKINSEDLMKFRFKQSSWTAIEGSPATIIVEPTQAVVDGPYTITYTFTNGSAGSGDYTAAGTPTSLTFSNGETAAKSFTVNTASDATVEGNETFTVTLAVAPVSTGEINAPNPTTVTISEDDKGVQLVAPSAAVTEGTATIDVTVQRIGTSTGAVSVDYATADGTATVASGDYTVASGTLNWASGDTADKVVSITIANDAFDEDDETLTFALSNPSAGTQLLSPNSQTITINDNDASPSLSINSTSVAEGNAGTASLAFVVTLSAASGKTVTVDHVSANGTATAGSDYTGIGSTLTFAPGETTKNTPVTVLADTRDEPNETLTVTLSNASNASIGTATGTGTITDDDAVTVSFSAAAQTVGEGTVMATVTAVRTGSTSFNVNVPFTVTGTATGTSDHNAVNGNISIPSTASSASYTFMVVNDTRDEADETVVFTMGTPTGGTVTATAPTTHTVTITDDDAAGVNVTQTGGSTDVTEGGATDSFTVSLGSQPSANVTITLDPGAQLTVSPTTLTFTSANFATAQTVTVTAANDDAVEDAHTGTISGSATSTDAQYNGSAFAIGVAITDNDSNVEPGENSPGLAVTSAGGTTTVAAGSSSSGAFSGSALMALLALLGLRRQRPVWLLAALALLPGVALSAETAKAAKAAAKPGPFSYQYADLRYFNGSSNSPDINVSGFSLSASMPFQSVPLFLVGGYSIAETDDFRIGQATGSVESKGWTVGAGARASIHPKIDLVLVASILKAKAEGQGGFGGGADDAGRAFEAGLRSWLTPKLEWTGAVANVAIFSDLTTSFNTQLLWHMNPSFAGVVGASASSTSNALNLGVRYNIR